MTFNWYHKIMLVLALFVAMMIYFAVRSVNTPLELVTDKYYEAEINYQDRINNTDNALALDEQPRVSTKDGYLIVQFPASMKDANGTLKFYFAANSAQDKEYPIRLDANGTQQIDISKRHGAYRIQLSWTHDGKAYFSESKLFL